MGDSLLTVEGLTYQINESRTRILDDVSLEVNQGDFLLITGSTGAGKTTLLKILNRVNKLTKGKITYKSKNYQEMEAIALRRQISLVSQEPKLLGMGGKEAIAYPLTLQKVPREIIEQKILDITELLNIPLEWLERKDYQLSQGEKHLITIARSLILEPEVLLLDEPIASLDVVSANYILTVLKKLTREGKLTVVIVTHQLDVVSPFITDLLYLKQGKSIYQKPVEEINWEVIKEELQRDIKEEIEEWS
jgi:D-methionine transport system ATP-binding protein